MVFALFGLVGFLFFLLLLSLSPSPFLSPFP
jgi:hypothetical protein